MFSFGKMLPDFPSGDNVGKKDPYEEKRIISPVRQIQQSLKLGFKIKTQERSGVFFFFFWLHWVLVAALGISVASYGTFYCGAQTL